jgi:gluconolactonase
MEAKTMAADDVTLDSTRCVLLIQDMQNDVVTQGGAFSASGAPIHCREQKAVDNIRRLAERCRELGIPVVHIWFIVEPNGLGMTRNAPLFTGALEQQAMLRGSWGAAPVAGLEPKAGDHVVEKNRMSAWEGTRLETILKAEKRDVVIDTGAWTNMSIEHTARTGADKGFVMVVPEDACSTMNAEWQRASIDFAMRNVAVVTTTDAVLQAFLL